jgi:hypothetical protein
MHPYHRKPVMGMVNPKSAVSQRFGMHKQVSSRTWGDEMRDYTDVMKDDLTLRGLSQNLRIIPMAETGHPCE